MLTHSVVIRSAWRLHFSPCLTIFVRCLLCNTSLLVSLSPFLRYLFVADCLRGQVNANHLFKFIYQKVF